MGVLHLVWGYYTQLYCKLTDIASYILSSYSFIDEYPLSKIPDIGDPSKDGCPIPSFDQEALIELCSETEKILIDEQNVLTLEGDFIIVGDIHGSFHDLLRILIHIKDDHHKVLFLGDYVDRGEFSLECITLLFALKILYKSDIFLLRGNHEFDSICSKYGFKDEILGTNPLKLNKSESSILVNQHEKGQLYLLGMRQNHSYKYTEKLYEAFIHTFAFLPIAALINNTTFCIHGGLCPELKHIKIIQSNIQRPVYKFEENQLLKNLVWSDPTGDTVNMYTENQRGCGYQFNFEAVHFFLEKNSIKRIVRGHQYFSKGYYNHFQNKCLTVFSASSYEYDMSNISVILKLNQRTDSIERIKFQPIKRINKEDAFYYKVNVYNSNCDEIKPKCYSFPPLNSLTSFNGIINNSTFKSIPNKIYNKASSNVIHLKKYPIHLHHRRTSPLIKINSSLINVKVNSLLAEPNQAKTDESDLIRSYPVMDLNLIQEEFND